jgi:methyl coenzyme M reductase subunit C-like uncharacterized protein (methanogenesis marker protein 7)
MNPPHNDLSRCWDGLLQDLEAQAKSPGKAKASALKAQVETLMEEADAVSAPSDVVDRLDGLLVALTEAVRDACTNEKCPHYGKKCKMR